MPRQTANPTYAVVDTLTGDPRRINLAGAERIEIERTDWHTGIDLVAVYVQPRAQRVIYETFSRWDNGKGRVGGQRFTEADNDAIAGLAREFPAECGHLAAWLPELSDEI